MLTIDALASRYGKLPSEVIKTSSTFDLFIYDTAMSYMRKVQEGQESPNTAYTQDELLKMIQETRTNANES